MRFPEAFKVLRNKEHSRELHGMRVIAILAVFLGHLTVGLLPPRFQKFMYILDFSMDVLFVMSGFLIGTILFISVERKDPHYIVRFYLRRAMRLFPVYYVTLFFMAYYIRGGPDFSDKYFWQELFFFTNYNPHAHYLIPWSWALSVDEHFYLIIPFVIMMISRFLRNHQLSAYVSLVGLAYLVNVIVVFFVMDNWGRLAFNDYIYRPTHTRAIFLLSGVVAAYLSYYEPERVKAFFRNRKINVICSLTPIFLGALWVMMLELFYWPERTPLVTLVIWPISALTWVIYHLMALHAEFGFRRVLKANIFLYLSSICYGVFLVHPIVIKELGIPYANYEHLFTIVLNAPYFEHIAIGLVMTVTVTLFISYLLHVLVEKPIMQLRERISIARANSSGSLTHTGTTPT